MSNEATHLAIDLGASSGRVIAGRVEDGKLTLHEIHRFANDPVRVQGSLHWNLHGLWAEILQGLRKAAQQYDSIRSVGVDSWGVDYVLVDDHDQLAGPVRHYRDARTDGMMQAACETLGSGKAEVGREQIFAETGLQFMEINTVYQLFSAVKNQERSLQIADGFLMIGDFFHWLLSGQRSIEATNASTTQMLNPTTGQWSSKVIQGLGIPEKILTPVVQPATILGPVQPSVADATGLKDVSVVLPATHDTASAVLAVPAEDFAAEKPDWCYISSGTWSLMGCEVAKPVVNDLCSQLNFTNEGGVVGSTRLLQNIPGLWIFQQLRKSLQRRDQDMDWAQMVQQAEAATAFECLIDPDAPEFVAPLDMMDAMEHHLAATGQPKATGVAAYLRTSLESLALRYRVCLDMLEQLVDNRIDTIHIVGGGSMNEFLCQMAADACNRTVIAGPVEATAIGNVVMQMIGVGTLESAGDEKATIRAARAMIRESFAVKTYLPGNPTAWDEPAERFLSLRQR